MATLPESGQGIELLGAEEVAALLGVKESTIWRWCREGRLPALKVGKRWRVRREAHHQGLPSSVKAASGPRRAPGI